MGKFAGYTSEQKYRVAWDGGASESMTLDEARVLQASKPGSWLEMYNGYEWERVGV